MLCVGNDWSEDHHDVHLMDPGGTSLAKRRFDDSLDGLAGFHALVAEYVDDPDEVVIGIETDRGLWVAGLIAAGYRVLAVNPKAASRYRDRHSVSGAKSDAGDAKMLADLVRTDRHNHRLIAGDSPLVEGIKVQARAHQNLIWARARQSNQLRNTLREYYPAALEAFDDLTHRDALAVLQRAATPQAGARLTKTQIVTALKRGGRKRRLEPRATEIQQALRQDQLTAPEALNDAFGATTKALVAVLLEFNEQIAQLQSDMGSRFEQHPDAAIIRSLPGLGVVIGARVLGEFGDDPNRYADAKSRRNYAGTSPLTIESGKTRNVRARYIRNRRLYDAIDQWAFCSLQASPGCRDFYDERRAAGDLHHQALRALGNRLVGYLHGCLNSHTHYNEHTAWAHRQPPIKAKAA